MTRHTLLLGGPLIALALIVAESAGAQPAGHELGVDGSQLTRTPAVTVVPAYPDEALRDRREGETTVCFRVDSRGRVTRAGVRSSTHEIFNRPAIKAIRASNFEALLAVRGQSPSAVCRSYRFDLDAIEVVDAPTALENHAAVTTTSLTASSGAPPPADLAPDTSSLVTASADADGTVPDVETVPLYEEGGETICRSMKRPGSRIAEMVCYTREEALARQAASNRTVADLAREQQWREQAIHEAAMKNRFPGVPGMSR